MALKIRPVESYAAENNPTFFSSKLRQAKFIAEPYFNNPFLPLPGGCFFAPFFPSAPSDSLFSAPSGTLSQIG